jgi:hypothetical protein
MQTALSRDDGRVFPVVSSLGRVSVISTEHVGGAALAPLGSVGINPPVDRIYADDIAAGVSETAAIGRAASQANGQ